MRLVTGEQCHIQLATQQHLLQLGDVVLPHLQTHIRIAGEKVAQHLRQQLLTAVAHQADAQRAHGVTAQQADGLGQLRLGLHDPPGSLHIQRAGRREHGGRFAAHEDGLAQLRLNLADGLGERGLSDAQRLGGGGEAALAHDGKDHAGMTGVHRRNSLLDRCF